MKTTISPTSATTTEHAPNRAQHVPAHARHIAAQLSALFDRDTEIVKQLNDAHHRHQVANEQLRHASDAPDGSPQIHWQIHRALGAYHTPPSSAANSPSTSASSPTNSPKRYAPPAGAPTKRSAPTSTNSPKTRT